MPRAAIGRLFLLANDNAQHETGSKENILTGSKQTWTGNLQISLEDFQISYKICKEFLQICKVINENSN